MASLKSWIARSAAAHKHADRVKHELRSKQNAKKLHLQNELRKNQTIVADLRRNRANRKRVGKKKVKQDKRSLRIVAKAGKSIVADTSGATKRSSEVKAEQKFAGKAEQKVEDSSPQLLGVRRKGKVKDVIPVLSKREIYNLNLTDKWADRKSRERQKMEREEESRVLPFPDPHTHSLPAREVAQLM